MDQPKPDYAEGCMGCFLVLVTVVGFVVGILYLCNLGHRLDMVEDKLGINSAGMFDTGRIAKENDALREKRKLGEK